MATRKSINFSEYLGKIDEFSDMLPAGVRFMMHFSVCRILGTPTNSTWPGVQDLPDFKANFPQWAEKPLIQVIPKLGAQGCDALKVFSRNNRGNVLSAPSDCFY